MSKFRSARSVDDLQAGVGQAVVRGRKRIVFLCAVSMLVLGCKGASEAQQGRFGATETSLRPHGKSKVTVVFVNDMPLPAASASAALKQLSEAKAGATQVSSARRPTIVPKLSWDVPNDWHSVEPSSAMRLKQYELRVEGDARPPLELAVYYFGPRGAGGVEDTFDRWAGSFGPDASRQRASWKSGGMDVYLISTQGDYHVEMMSSGAENPQGAVKKDWALLGAYVRGPDGPYYFKLLGPSDLVGAVRPSFVKVLHSLKSTAGIDAGSQDAAVH